MNHEPRLDDERELAEFEREHGGKMFGFDADWLEGLPERVIASSTNAELERLRPHLPRLRARGSKLPRLIEAERAARRRPFACLRPRQAPRARRRSVRSSPRCTRAPDDPHEPEPPLEPPLRPLAVERRLCDLLERTAVNRRRRSDSRRLLERVASRHGEVLAREGEQLELVRSDLDDDLFDDLAGASPAESATAGSALVGPAKEVRP